LRQSRPALRRRPISDAHPLPDARLLPGNHRWLTAFDHIICAFIRCPAPRLGQDEARRFHGEIRALVKTPETR
jgi:hypothetical protein